VAKGCLRTALACLPGGSRLATGIRLNDLASLKSRTTEAAQPGRGVHSTDWSPGPSERFEIRGRDDRIPSIAWSSSLSRGGDREFNRRRGGRAAGHFRWRRRAEILGSRATDLQRALRVDGGRVVRWRELSLERESKLAAYGRTNLLTEAGLFSLKNIELGDHGVGWWGRSYGTAAARPSSPVGGGASAPRFVPQGRIRSRV